MTGHKAMGAHHSAAAGTTTWLTPPEIITGLGGAGSFDIDPCAFPGWMTARHMVCQPDDGLAVDWLAHGRAWVNPPYGNEAGEWLAKLQRGTALIFARTETEMFQREVFGKAHGLLFLAGRLHFHYPDGSRAKANAGAPSVLCAYGQDDLDRLAASDLQGALTPLRFARFVMVACAPLSWREELKRWMAAHDGPVSVSDAYRYFARHPKAKTNPNWRAKVRQQLARHGRRVGPAQYAAA